MKNKLKTKQLRFNKIMVKNNFKLLYFFVISKLNIKL